MTFFCNSVVVIINFVVLVWSRMQCGDRQYSMVDPTC
jgi:hypothetical protein